MSENEIDVEGLRRVAEAATPGPWGHSRFFWKIGSKYGETMPDRFWRSVDGLGGIQGSIALIDSDDEQAQDDAEFIATARNNWGALLDEVEALRGQVERMTALRDSCANRAAKDRAAIEAGGKTLGQAQALHIRAENYDLVASGLTAALDGPR